MAQAVCVPRALAWAVLEAIHRIGLDRPPYLVGCLEEDSRRVTARPTSQPSVALSELTFVHSCRESPLPRITRTGHPC